MRQTKPYVTIALVAANVVLFALEALGLVPDSWLLDPYAVAAGDGICLLTSMFLHGGPVHLGNNMISLWWTGSTVERVYGHLLMAVIYVLSGVAGGVLYTAVHLATGDPSPALGASGAIFGLFGCYGHMLLTFRREAGRRVAAGDTSAMAPVADGLRAYLGMLALNAFIGVTSSGIANEAHIGGLVCGFLLACLFGRGREERWHLS